MNLKAWRRALVLLLAALAAIVLVGLCAETNMWSWILAYWAALTAKNVLDSILE